MSTAIRPLPLLCMLVLALGVFPAIGAAQITRGAISGTVRDSSGLVVPGATVTVTNVETNASLTAVSDSVGFYRVAPLEPGRYDVTTELAGFATAERRDVDVPSATEVSIGFELRPAGVGEAITVAAEAITLNRVTPTIATTIPQRMVVELPLGGDRNINNLMLTIPNTASVVGQGSFAVNGNRSRNNNFMIDGSDNNDISVTIATSQIVPEAVAQYQVLQNPYSVEFGRNSGGQINVITRSGTNRFTGDAWDYYTSSKFFSLNNLEKASGREDPARFIRHQMGVDVGGPAMRDNLFFFGLYQRDTQRPGPRPGTTVRILTPEGFAALQAVPLRAGQSAASRQAVLQQLGFLQSILGQNLAFRNTSTTLANGVPITTGQVNIDIVDPSTYHTVLGRGDYRLGSGDTVTVRYSLNHRSDVNAISNCNFGATFCGNQKLIDTNLAASNTRLFSDRLLNEFRFSLVRRDLDFPENDPRTPTTSIAGLFQIGGNSNFPQSRLTNSYQFSDTLTRTLTRHTLKFGADIRYNDVDNNANFNAKGTFTFNSLQDYLNNTAFRFTQAVNTASWFATQWQTFLFVQDDFRVNPDLTVNLGLRYEVSQVPFGMFGATDAESLGARVPGPVEADKDNWAPRVGFAWSPRTSNAFLGDGVTVVRGGFGMGYDVLFYNLLTVNASNFPRVVTAEAFNVVDTFPSLLPVSATAVFNPLATYVNSAENTENPESRFYSLSLQRELGPYVLEVGYSGSKGYKGINQIEMNPAVLTQAQAAQVASTRSAGAIPGVQARRLFPQVGSRVTIPAYDGPGDNDVEARSTYNAVFFSANRRLSQGLQFQTSYTYSRWYSNNDASLGEQGTQGSSQRPQSMFDYEAEWSRSQFDRPHRFTASYIWEIPGPDDGLLRPILGGWQLSGITQAQSGRPFTIVTGVDSSGDGNTGSDRPNINPSGRFVWDDRHRNLTNEGFYVVPLGTNNLPLANSLGNGNAPRNSERMAGFWNTDLSLAKAFTIADTRRLFFRADVINVFNQDNYGGAPGTTIQTTFNNMSSPSFGQNTNNWGRREMSLSVKVTW
ncbi:MAG: TonB-dependent receptor [Acidobacteria bacterium]|nr:TonB-dependent receptor [Acidobacteriota bacterium]